MTTPTQINTQRDFVVYQGGSDAILTRPIMYGKVNNLAQIMPKQGYMEAPNGLGVAITPDMMERFEEMSWEIQDWSAQPERLYGPDLKTIFIPRAIFRASDGSLRTLPTRYLVYFSQADMGTTTHGTLATITPRVQPIEVWCQSISDAGPTAFAERSAPTAADAYRYNSNVPIHWSNGVDLLAPNKTALGLTAGG